MRLESENNNLNNHLMNARRNYIYISESSQNDIIDACNEVMLKKLVERINQCKMIQLLGR